MIRAEDVIENPVTGERIVFHQTKTNRKGMPNPLRLAVIARAHFNVVRLPFPPAFVQRLGLALGAPLGRLLGYAPIYTASGEPLAANT